MIEIDEAIKNVVYDDENIVDIIKSAPQTYNSILKHLKDNGTLQVILRRRIKRLLKENKIWKMRVPGTRFGLVLFCTPDRDYKILISQSLIKVRVFYMMEFSENDTHIVLENYWELNGPNWSRWVFNNEPLQIAKYTLRDGGYRLWE